MWLTSGKHYKYIYKSFWIGRKKIFYSSPVSLLFVSKCLSDWVDLSSSEWHRLERQNLIASKFNRNRYLEIITHSEYENPIIENAKRNQGYKCSILFIFSNRRVYIMIISSTRIAIVFISIVTWSLKNY